MFEQLGLIGCGLMGGSFALALRALAWSNGSWATASHPAPPSAPVMMGVIDIEAPSALLAVSGADIVLIAVPVAATEATFKAIKHLVTPNMLVMDVGSTKRDVIDAGRRALREQIGSFVPAHPITGKEVSGVEHADPDLYTGRQVILTPIERTLTAQLQKAVDVWTASGLPGAENVAGTARRRVCRCQPPATPDRICLDERHLRPTPGQGLPVAGRPRLSRLHPHRGQRPQVWRDILISNREELLAQSKIFQRNLQGLGIDDFQRQWRGD
jgi:prephenate dehydrogenase